MTKDTQNIRSGIDLQDLEEGMTITAYSSFDDKYRSMDGKTRDWVKLNFKGAGIVVERSGEELDLKIGELKIGDTIRRIHKFPSSLKNISKVNSKLVKELEARGFRRFEIEKVPPRASKKSPQKQKAINQANDFVENIKQSLTVCENATQAVESLMDEVRNGKADIRGVKEYIDDLADENKSEAVTAIISMKENDQIYSHCTDVGVVFQAAYFEIKRIRNEASLFKDEKEAMLGAFLHDIGKAKIPKEILESTTVFKRNSKEIEMIHKHPVMGAELLSSIGMPDYIVNMAHYHHVKHDNTMASSYPPGVENSEVLFETRLLSLIDAYQALVAGRSYKKSWTPPAVMKYLDAIAGVEFDLQLWEEFLLIMGHYPKGSLVQLNDGSLAFVVSVPEKEVLRPQVVRVRTAAGEDLQHHDFIDLQNDLDVSIVKDLDSRSVFEGKALDIIANLQIT
ncbi:MAG: HD domain-containing protein [Proteobacteria bacterium]|nr:HD domain-containing protein [Pseudomonadota bacterium]